MILSPALVISLELWSMDFFALRIGSTVYFSVDPSRSLTLRFKMLSQSRFKLFPSQSATFLLFFFYYFFYRDLKVFPSGTALPSIIDAAPPVIILSVRHPFVLFFLVSLFRPLRRWNSPFFGPLRPVSSAGYRTLAYLYALKSVREPKDCFSHPVSYSLLPTG